MLYSRLNLLPLDHRKRVLRRVRGKQWLLIIMSVAFLAACAVAVRYSQLLRVRGMCTVREFKVRPVRAREIRMHQLDEELQKLHRPDGLLAESIRLSQPLRVLALVLGAVDSGGQLQIQRWHLQRVKSPSGDAPVSGLMELVLSGVAVDNGAVSQFTTRLENANVFDSVELGSIREQRGQEVSLREYVLTCRYEEYRL